MSRHQKIFVELFKASGYTAKQVSGWSGITESALSRFINGKVDLRAGDFFELLACFPEEFQEHFWIRFRQVKDDWRSLVSAATTKEIETILNAIAERYSRDHARERDEALAVA